ncbi:hypothetical protein CPC08DRAFT_762135 [Agrocybe pediades]|nr:hypothetical protein CPC08DRAFT_762135 [Agrocybe pediades]
MPCPLQRRFYELLLPVSSAPYRRPVRPPPPPSVVRRPPSTTARIAYIVNASWDVGTEHCVRPLARIISPVQEFYLTNMTPAILHDIQEAPTTFILMPVREIFPFRVLNSQFAIVFRIDIITAPHTSLALAYTLCHFMESFIRDHDRKVFAMVGILFRFTRTGCYGVFTVNNNFADAFEEVSMRIAHGIPLPGPVTNPHFLRGRLPVLPFNQPIETGHSEQCLESLFHKALNLILS